jgi:tripartite-type tricarboxylate transporter receptor subunit TctC
MKFFRSRSALSAAAIMAAALSLAGHPSRAESVEDFYKGKSITITVGYTPGGSYDYYARVFAEHMGKYIPGAPTIIVRNQPGAGSLVAANYLFNVAPKDGTALGVVTQTVMLEGPLGTPGVKFDATQFSYIGRMSLVLETMIGRADAPAKTIAEVRQHEMIAGGTGPTSPTEGYPRLLNAFAGTKFRIVSGFGGTSDLMLALERHEIDALENSWNSILRTQMEWVDDKKINVLVQAVSQRNKQLPDTPTLVEMASNPEDRAALEFYVSSANVSRSLLGPPEIPPDRLKALRAAFDEATKDAQLRAEIEKTGSEFEPASGEYLEGLAQKVASTPKSVIERTAAALQAK